MIDKYRTIADHPFIVADTETTGLDWHTDRVFSVAVALPTGDSNYYDMRDENDARWLRDELPKAQRVVNHHIKFDLHMLLSSGIRIDPRRCICTMITAALLNEHEESFSLDALARKYVGIGKDEKIWEELAAMFGGKPDKKSQIGNLPRAPVALAGRYAMQDTLATLKLWEYQQPLIELQGLTRVHQVEHALLGVLLDVERRGVAVDVGKVHHNIQALSGMRTRHQAALNSLAGRVVNANSGPQVAKLLVKSQLSTGGFLAVDDLTVFPATDSGKSASIQSEQLRKMHHPIANAIVELRSLDKTINTFLMGHILAHERQGRIHCNYNQTRSDNNLGTGTGRLSINDPALQQIHKRDKLIAPYVRGCFIPNEGQRWYTLDWSQMDFRIFAHYAKSQPIYDAYTANPDADFHGTVAGITGLPRDRKPGTGGGNAKQINLGMVFGMQPGRMAQEMGLPYTRDKTRSGRDWLRPGPEAEEVFNRYHAAVPGVRELLASATSIAKDRGFVKTALGRRIRFPGGQFTHKAAGLVFQGTAADALKVKLIEVYDILRGTDVQLLLNVHDEFDLSAPINAKPVIDEVVACIERFGPGDAIPLRVPIRCSVGWGTNWWEASGESPDHAALSRSKRC